MRTELEAQLSSAQQDVKERERRVAVLVEEVQTLEGQVQRLERALNEREDQVGWEELGGRSRVGTGRRDRGAQQVR